MKARKGFTIVELLAVIGVLATLITIVVSAAGGAIKNAREQRAETMRVALEQAIAAYHAQDTENRWPGPIENHVDDTEEAVRLTDSEADEVFREVVGAAFGKSKIGRKTTLIDASALLVCNSSKANGKNPAGVEFPVAANRNSKHNIPFSSMSFGYPEKEKGYFRRYKVTYITKTDSVTVSK